MRHLISGSGKTVPHSERAKQVTLQSKNKFYPSHLTKPMRSAKPRDRQAPHNLSSNACWWSCSSQQVFKSFRDLAIKSKSRRRNWYVWSSCTWCSHCWHSSWHGNSGHGSLDWPHTHTLNYWRTRAAIKKREREKRKKESEGDQSASFLNFT